MHHILHFAMATAALFVLFFVLLISILTYFLPTAIACYRGVREKYVIGALNLLFGWSIIGWILCACWAVFGTKRGAGKVDFFGQVI